MGSTCQNLTTNLVFYVNGEKVEVNNPRQEWTLLDYLRSKLRLNGTKESCGEGGCGACTVMLSKFDSTSEQITNKSINSCLTPLASIHSCAIVTVEGLGNIRTGLHPVQERIAKSHGTQCGFCTPGFVMSMYTLLKNTQNPTENQLEHNFAGNLCRCTGYRPILQGFGTFCQNQEDIEEIGSNFNGVPTPAPGMCNVLCNKSDFKPYDPNNDPIFPKELKKNFLTQTVMFECNNGQTKWFIPNSLTKAIELTSQFLSSSVLVAGNTALGLKSKFVEGKEKSVVIQISNIPELNVLDISDKELIIGSCVTFDKLEEFYQKNGKSGSVIDALHYMTRSFAGQQIRNMATIGGNILMAHPSSHLTPILLAMKATATIQRISGTRVVKFDGDLFQHVSLEVDEILKHISVPINTDPDENEYVWWQKQSRRKVNDVGIVNCCMSVKYSNELVIKGAALAYGGCGIHVKLATKTSTHLINKKIGPLSMEEINKLLEADFAGHALGNYKKMLIKSFFIKFWTALGRHVIPDIQSTTKSCRGMRSSQLFEIRPPDQLFEDMIGKPFAHVSALKHATGEAIYTNDVPVDDSHLFGSLVLSTRAHAKLISIDASSALSLDGVVSFFDSRDLRPEQNIHKDEQVFATDKVTCVGQIIGFIVAVDQQTADRGARLVKVKYEDIFPLVITIEDAIKNESYMHRHSAQIGDVELAFKNAKHIIEGEMKVGGQEHFYMETHSCVVIPKEDDEIELFISSQGSNDMQQRIGHCLGIPANRIIYRTKRIGGGFGGKGAKVLGSAIPTAVAVHRLRRPIRCILNRRVDMTSTGGRNPALVKFKVGFDSNGKIDGVQEWIYLNGGNTLDCSGSVLDHMIVMHDSAYNIPNWKIEGFVCKTNLPSNTAFRGYGIPQIHISTETIMDKVAEIIQNSESSSLDELEDGRILVSLLSWLRVRRR